MIISSEIVIDTIQTDGRSVIREKHISDDGQTYYIDYMASPDMDIQARLIAHADNLNLNPPSVSVGE